MARDEYVAFLLVAKRLGSIRHVTRGELAAGTVLSAMGVLGDGTFQAGGIVFRMVAQAELIAGRDQVRWIAVALHLMAIKTAQTAVIHGALDEVIALHAVLMGAAVGEEIEILRAGLSLFEMPEVCEAIPRKIADGAVHIQIPHKFFSAPDGR